MNLHVDIRVRSFAQFRVRVVECDILRQGPDHTSAALAGHPGNWSFSWDHDLSCGHW